MSGENNNMGNGMRHMRSIVSMYAEDIITILECCSEFAVTTAV